VANAGGDDPNPDLTQGGLRQLHGIKSEVLALTRCYSSLNLHQ
jgi:hypothetical protein